MFVLEVKPLRLTQDRFTDTGLELPLCLTSRPDTELCVTLNFEEIVPNKLYLLEMIGAGLV